MSAIYGGLFRLVADDDGKNAKVVPHQAAGYEFADGGKTVRIKIKPGIKFTDGTPFDAAAVVFNIKRDMEATCTCKPTWQLAAQDPITAEGTDTVVLKFQQPNAAVINSFVVSNVNWIVSPTALQQMGADAFRIKPVGAGPFKVVSDELSSELVLERNPDYFVPDRPYLDKLTIRSIGGDQPAYQALLAGQGQVYEGMTTIPLLEEAKKNSQLVVTQQPATSPYVIQLNTKIPPFNDKRAREAIYYATNVEAIRQGLFKGAYPASQTFTADGGLFHHPTIPGYRTYDLEKAKALVAAARRADRRSRHAQGVRGRPGEHRAADASGRRPASRPRSTPNSSTDWCRTSSAASGRRCCRPRAPGIRPSASASGSGSARPRRSAASATRPSTTCCSRPPR